MAKYGYVLEIQVVWGCAFKQVYVCVFKGVCECVCLGVPTGIGPLLSYFLWTVNSVGKNIHIGFRLPSVFRSCRLNHHRGGVSLHSRSFRAYTLSILPFFLHFTRSGIIIIGNPLTNNGKSRLLKGDTFRAGKKYCRYFALGLFHIDT